MRNKGIKNKIKKKDKNCKKKKKKEWNLKQAANPTSIRKIGNPVSFTLTVISKNNKRLLPMLTVSPEACLFH